MLSALRSTVGVGLTVAFMVVLPSVVRAQVTVTPDNQASGTKLPSSGPHTAVFTVNPYAWAELDCWGTNGITCSSISPDFLSEGGAQQVEVTFSTSTSLGTGNVYLRASTVNPPECIPEFEECDELSDTGNRSYVINTPPTASFTWSPTTPDEGQSVSFNATASSDPSPGSIASYAWTFGDGQNGSTSTPSHAYGAGGQFTVTLTVTDNLGATDDTVRVIDVEHLEPSGLSLEDANPGLELNRSECVNVAVGFASVMCDDFVYAYAFTPLTVLNRSRQLALIYNRGTAERVGIVGVNVEVPTGQAEPDSICVEVDDIGAANPTTCYGDALYTPGTWTRFAVEANYGALTYTAELFEYDLTVTSYEGPAQEDSTASGHYVAVDNSKVFGTGWWLGSYERLTIDSDPTLGDVLVWFGGDQSYRVYTETSSSSNVFVAETRSRPDTITMSGSNYIRNLIGGGEAHFNSAGIHQKTVDRLGYETQFDHDGNNRPTAVKFTTPSAGTITGYELQYSSGRLEQVRVRDAAGSGWGTFTVWTTALSPGYSIDSIAAPDGKVTSFGHSSSVMTQITEPGGRRLNVTYDDRKASQVTLTNSGGGVTNVVYQFDPATPVGISTSGSDYEKPTATASVAMRLDGPRSDVSDTTYFYPTGWGAVRGIKDPENNETWIERTNGGYPALPTRVQHPNGWVVKATYHSNGLLNQVTDSSTSAVTSHSWNVTWSQPTQVTSPRGVVTAFQYNSTTGNLEWQAVGADTVHLSYNGDDQLSSILDPEGNTTTLGYDSKGNLTSETPPSSTGSWTLYGRDERGYATLTSSAIGPIGSGADTVRVATTYDVMGRVTQTLQTNTLDAMWLRTTNTYHGTTSYRTKTQAWGGVTASDSTTTGASEWVYDGLGRVILEKRPTGRDSLVYDVASNVLTRKLKSATDSTTVTMTYDVMNQLTQRSIPSRTDSTASIDGVQFPYYSTQGLSISGGTVTVFGDTETFDYDVMGNLIQADNRYARIRRTYFPNGALKADTLRLREYGDSTDWSTHVYGLRHDYDKDGQDSVVYHPDWLSGGSDKTTYQYSASTGRMSSVTDALSSSYSFTYNENGQPTLISFPEGSRAIEYDAVGRVASTGATEIVRDRGGRIIDAGTSLAEYNGFGHLVSSEIAVAGDPSIETFERDAFGSATYTNVFGWGAPNAASDNQFSVSGGHAQVEVGEWDFDEHPSEPTNWSPSGVTRAYDGRGNLIQVTDLQYSWAPEGSVDPWDEVRKNVTKEDYAISYFSASERLMAHQVSRDSTYHPEGAPDQEGASWGTFEEYWYDALGRRVLRRIREESPICTHGDRCSADAFERYVWNGDQLLWELQDTSADVQNPSTEIGYVHAGGIDQPLGMMRNGSSIILHPDWRGLFSGATNTSGTPQFTDVPWPAGAWRAAGNEIDPREDHTWVGSLAMGQSDQSGLQYRRNRYYDPGSGQFTQQDPIGIAGGLNLYGYANGDPINFSDPFGLCPPIEECIAKGLVDPTVLYHLAEGQSDWVSGIRLTANAATTVVAGTNDRGNVSLFINGNVTIENGEQLGLPYDEFSVDMAAVELPSTYFDVWGSKGIVSFSIEGNFRAGFASQRTCLLLFCNTTTIPREKRPNLWTLTMPPGVGR